MKLEEIYKEAGHFREPIEVAMAYLISHPTREGIAFQLERSRVENILDHFKFFKPKEVYFHYRTLYDKIRFNP